LEALADTILPGSAQAGVAGFVAAMMVRPDPLLAYRFPSPPEAPALFYRRALAALDRLSVRQHARVFPALDAKQRSALVGGLLSGTADGWDGPPFGLVYFALRNDALDALYGQPAAYDELEVPYMPHIAPPRPW